MTEIEKARCLFREQGLAFPTIPSKLAVKLKQLDKWLFSTREIDVSPYNLRSYVDEIETTELEDYAIVSHSGHGVNSYAIQYYLVYGSLRMFLHLSCGGIFTNREKACAIIQECFSVADDIVAAADNRLHDIADPPITLVASDCYGSYWAGPTKMARIDVEYDGNPVRALNDVLNWLTNCSRVELNNNDPTIYG